MYIQVFFECLAMDYGYALKGNRFSQILLLEEPT